MSSPISDRPVMPYGYGVPETQDGLLAWSVVESRLVESLHYWLATSRPDGTPHVVPRWGVWLDGAFWYDGSPQTLHARNVEANAACALHLEDGNEAVIVEGVSHMADPPGPDLGARLSSHFVEKYGERGYSPDADSWDGPDSGGLRVLTPSKAMAWFDFPTDVTRFRFHG